MLNRRLLIVSGKGGVGKSAVTAALARLATRKGKSVLAVAMTDAPGLASHLGLGRLDHDATRVSPRLEAMAISRARALDDYLHLQLRLPRSAPIGQVTRLFRVLVDTVPGVREIISMGKPIQDLWSGAHDLVIVDAPPLGQMFSYLSAPDTISKLVPSGAVRDQASRMRASLADAELSGLVLVTTFDELPVVETSEAAERVRTTGLIDIAAIVANRVLAPVALPVAEQLPPGPIGDAARLHDRLVTSQERWSDRLGPARRLPFFFGRLSPTDIVASAIEAWEEP